MKKSSKDQPLVSKWLEPILDRWGQEPEIERFNLMFFLTCVPYLTSMFYPLKDYRKAKSWDSELEEMCKPPVWFLSDWAGDQTSAVWDRDPPGNPEATFN